MIRSIQTVAASFTRPADTTAYAAGDLVANSTAAASVVPLSWVPNKQRSGFWLKGVRLRLDKSDITNAQFRVHLYSASPTFVTAGDNSAFATVVATGYASWLCSLDTTFVMRDVAGAAGVALPGSAVILPMPFDANATIYGLIEALAAYTPKSAGVITGELLLEQL